MPLPGGVQRKGGELKRYLFAAGLSALVASLIFGGIAAGSKLMRPYHPPSMLKKASLGKVHAPTIPIRLREHGRTVTVERKVPFFSAGPLAAMYGNITNEELHFRRGCQPYHVQGSRRGAGPSDPGARWRSRHARL